MGESAFLFKENCLMGKFKEIEEDIPLNIGPG
jgi:hypothetical protein